MKVVLSFDSRLAWDNAGCFIKVRRGSGLIEGKVKSSEKGGPANTAEFVYVRVPEPLYGLIHGIPSHNYSAETQGGTLYIDVAPAPPAVADPDEVGEI